MGINSMLSARNDADQGLAYVKDFGDVRISDAYGTHSPDQDDIVVGEFSLEWRRAQPAEFLGVSGVISECAPFKIGDDVVGFDRINVIHNRKVVRVWNESNCHQTMDVKSERFSFLPQNKARVSSGKLWSQDFSDSALRMPIVMDDLPRHAPDATKVAYFVVPLVSNDGSPFFSEYDIHEAGYPSGTSGLMIKDPPRATTFGGSAFMARRAENYNLTLQ